jgi:hypothetical protein
MTPVSAAGIITKLEIDMLEAHLKRKQNLLPSDTKSLAINSVYDHFVTSTSSVIARLASSLRDFYKKDKRLETKIKKRNKKIFRTLETARRIKETSKHQKQTEN